MIGCHRKPTYPGYTQVSFSHGETYYLDLSTLSRLPLLGKNTISVAEIIQNSDKTHTVGTLFTDCSVSKSFLEEWTTFDEKGSVISSEKAREQNEQAVQQLLCSKSAALPFFTGFFDRKAALVAFLGVKDTEWTPNPPLPLDGYLPDAPGEAAHATVILDKEYSEASKTKHLLVISSVPIGEYSCHACGVLISAVIFRRDNSGWFEDASNAYLTTSGSFGAPPKAEFSQLGPDRYGFNLASGYMGQGVETEYQEFFTAVGEKVASILQVQTLSSEPDFDGGPDTSTSTSLKWESNVTNGFYNLSLLSQGNKLDQQSAAIPVVQHQICKMTSVKYECR
jgi:hypothetical protein